MCLLFTSPLDAQDSQLLLVVPERIVQDLTNLTWLLNFWIFLTDLEKHYIKYNFGFFQSNSWQHQQRWFPFHFRDHIWQPRLTSMSVLIHNFQRTVKHFLEYLLYITLYLLFTWCLKTFFTMPTPGGSHFVKRLVAKHKDCPMIGWGSSWQIMLQSRDHAMCEWLMSTMIATKPSNIGECFSRCTWYVSAD